MSAGNGDDPRHLAPIPREDPRSTPPGGAESERSDAGSGEQVVRAMARDVANTALRVDGLIVDVRHLTTGQRAQRASIAALARRTQVQAKALDATAAATLQHAASLSDLATAIGTPPHPEALMRASITDLTPEAIERLELGTGLHRAIARRDVADMQAARAAGRSAGTRGAVIGGGATAVLTAVIANADKIAELARIVFGG